MTDTTAPKRLTYRDTRPVVLPGSLDELQASLSSTVTLPTRLNWSPKREFNLADHSDLESLYVSVIQEASTPADFRDYLNVAVLEQLWPTLNVGPFLARRWAERFPELPPRSDTAA